MAVPQVPVAKPKLDMDKLQADVLVKLKAIKAKKAQDA